ncbi:ABC transporter permease [Rhodobacter ferrooxidans]|uniref:Binding-protein-dependent transport systems inner membrane component n=1 Tax=Rhodobacter ferrooxidans TaxID=371731 RepID=C8S0L8_9RHOB|nr:ABC transporter permease [Rhodobacter sp. SW2]EEW25552.1 binding-protein-dependent transport systems inner membrane component [Rhodobacter sp. SW2]
MKIPVLRIYTIGYLIFLYAPILLLPLFAFNDSKVIAFPLSGFTTQWFAQMWADEQMFNSFKNSLIVAGSASVLATTFGVFAARASTRYNFPGKAGILGLIMLPLVLPEMIVAMSLLVVLLAVGVPLSIFTIILGHVLICTPFAVAILTSAFQSLDRSLEEAAYDLGETAWSTFRLIILPLVMPGIISSLLIAFTISLDEFIIAFFLGGNETTLSVYIFGQFRFPAKVPAIMALGTVLVCLSICLLTIAEYFRRRGIAKTGAKDTGGFL